MLDIDDRAPLAGGREGPKRLIGLALVAAVLATVLVVAAIRGRVIPGHAVGPPIAAVAQVGDCVTGDISELGEALYLWSPALPFIKIEPCNGSRYGEVVFVLADFAAADASARSGNDPFSQCVRKSDEYLGIPPRLPLFLEDRAAPTMADPLFQPAAGVLVAYLGPDARARAAGQTWGACVVYLPTSEEGSGPVVDHSLRGAWQRDDDSRFFAMCLGDPTALVMLHCHVPHRFELVGMSWGTPSASQESIDMACREIAGQALGSVAALDSGILIAQVVAVRPNPINDGTLISGPAAVSVESPYINNCLLTPADNKRLLTAPLRGLRDAPVPLN